jgi:predicted TPR repeat methyltransferase
MLDPFGRTDKLDDQILEALAQRFEARGKPPLFSRMLAEYLEAMNIGATAAVLDIGCGTGLAARAIARRPGFSGKVTGVDLSRYLVDVAHLLAREDGVADRDEFRSADAVRLGWRRRKQVTSRL